MRADRHLPVCDYEGSAYRTEFWGQGRDYEDAAERVALETMLPPTGRRLIDIGGGYGRLVPLYRGYDEVIIFDYALSQLREAQALWGTEQPDGPQNLTYVAGDFYHLPFAPATFDTVVIVRALHHAADAPAVLRNVSQLLAGRGTLILEFANKRNLKAIIRYLLGRQAWSPFDTEPVEFVPLNFDFHPKWIRDTLANHRLLIQDRRAVSSFRLAFLKRHVPTHVLVTLDRIVQPLGGRLPLSPSVFLRCQVDQDASPVSEGPPLRCTACGSTRLNRGDSVLRCGVCGSSFPIRGGIPDFRFSGQLRHRPISEPSRAQATNTWEPTDAN